MKNILLLFFFSLIFSLTSSAQNGNTEKETKKYSSQMGTDVGVLFKKLLHPQNDNISFTPSYALTFKGKKTNKNIAFRVGIGGNYEREVEIDQDENYDDLTRSQGSILLRVGMEKQKPVSKRWEYYYGIDVAFFGSKTKWSSVFDGITFNNSPPAVTQAFSLNPLLGVQFRLTPHLVLQTEVSISFYQNTFSGTSIFFFNPTSFPTQLQPALKDTSEYGAKLVIPNILNLMLEF